MIAAGAGGWQIYQQRLRDRQAREDAARATSLSSQPLAEVAKPAETASSTGQTNEGTAKPETPTTSPAPAKVAGEIAASQKNLLAAEASKPGLTGAATPTSAGTTPSANQQPFEVTVRATDKAWVSIKSDGQYKVRGIIAPPDVKTIHATDQIVFFTGNASAVEISFNGQRVPLVGGPNSEGVLVFNSHGVVIPKPAAPKPQP